MDGQYLATAMSRRMRFVLGSAVICLSLAGNAPAAVIPPHVALAEQMVDGILPANNSYTYATPTVRFTGINGATAMYNASDCSSFITKLLQASYKFTNAMFTSWTGDSNPQAEDYYAAAMANKGFLHFSNVNAIQPGDLFIIRYTGDQTDTGHMTLITAAPTYDGVSTRSETLGDRVYTLPILDCTSTPHGSSDSRYDTQQTGVGTGFMRLYTDSSGNLITYSWNNYVNGVVYATTDRLPTFASLAIPEPGCVSVAVPIAALLRRRRR